MLKKFLSNTTYRNDIIQFMNYIIGYVMVLFLSYGVNVLLNKKLSREELGVFSYVQGLINIVAPISCLAFYNAYLRFHNSHTLSRNMLLLGVPFYLFSALICSVLIGIVTKSFIPLLYAFFIFFTEKQYILRVQMQIWKLNLLRCLELFVPLTFLWIFFILKKDVTAVWVLFFYGIGFCLSFLFSSQSKINDDVIPHKDLLAYLLPVVGTSFITFMLLNAGVIICKHYLGLSGAGEWGVAARTVAIFKSFTSLFLMFFPMIYFREVGNRNYKIITIYRIAIITVAFVMLLPFVFFAKQIYILFGAERYVSSSALLIFLAIGELFHFISSVCGLFFDYEIKTWKNTIFKSVELTLFIIGTIFARESLLAIGVVYLVAALISFIGIVYCSITSEIKFFKTISSKERILSL